MLIPDAIHPKQTIYYVGAMILKHLQQNGATALSDLYVSLRTKHEYSFPIVLYALDWLYLIDAAKCEDGVVKLQNK